MSTIRQFEDMLAWQKVRQLTKKEKSKVQLEREAFDRELEGIVKRGEKT